MSFHNAASERRTAARISSKQVIQIRSHGSDGFSPAVTRDVSSCAAYLYTEQKFLEGQRVEVLRLDLPSNDVGSPTIANRSGNVVRIDRIEPGRKYGIAVVLDSVESLRDPLDNPEVGNSSGWAAPRRQIRRFFRSRDVHLATAALAMLIVSAISTSVLVRALRENQIRTSQQLLDRGKQAMAAGQNEAAIRDFRAVLGFAPDAPEPRLRLAQALLSAGKLDEAKSDYLVARETDPHSGAVNLQLARLEATNGKADESERYYRAAIAGAWPTNAPAQRQQARIELARYLLSRNARSKAQSELLVIADNATDDVPVLNQTASLLMELGDPEQALAVYERWLAISPHDGAALLGAGEAAYASGRYLTAERLFSEFGESGQTAEVGSGVQQRLRDIHDSLSILPVPGLPAGERGDRALRVWDTVSRRLASCAHISLGSMLYARSQHDEPNVSGALVAVYQRWQAIHTQLQSSQQRWELRNNAVLQSQVTDLAYDIERQTAQSCGNPTRTDEALLRLAQHREGIQR